MLSAIFLLGCTENLEQTDGVYNNENAIHSAEKSPIEETSSTNEEKNELTLSP